MKIKMILATLCTLLLLLGGMGCEDEENETKDCFKLYGESLLKEEQTIEGLVVYSNDYESYVIKNKKGSVYLTCPLLEEVFCKENLEIKIVGDIYVGSLSEPDPDVVQGLIPVYRFKNYKISENN